MADDQKTSRFQRIALPHLDAAYGLARWLVRQPADAEDVTQEAMLRAYRSFDGCREATARPWLLRIVRNTALDWLTAKGRLRTLGFADIDAEDADGANFAEGVFGGTGEDPEHLLAREEERRLIDLLIAELPVPFREVVVLRDLEELSYREVAEIVGIPIGTVMSRLARGRDLLQKAWNERHG